MPTHRSYVLDVDDTIGDALTADAKVQARLAGAALLPAAGAPVGGAPAAADHALHGAAADDDDDPASPAAPGDELPSPSTEFLNGIESAPDGHQARPAPVGELVSGGFHRPRPLGCTLSTR